MQFEIDEQFENKAKIKVVGVGGAGGNAVNRMVQSGFTGVDFITINTDNMALEHSMADRKIAIGKKLTDGLGAGAKPDMGYQAIMEDREVVKQAIEGADMVFITAGMGGGTGTGAAPVVAEIAREMGILSVAVVTRPFLFEGPVRRNNATGGLASLNETVDTIITIQNQKILSIADKNTGFEQAFKMVDDVLTDAVRGISEIILKHGLVQVDFADVRAIMTGGGSALMGSGYAEGENRAILATERAIQSPLLDDISIAGASGLLVNITGGSDMGIHEVNDIMSFIYEQVGEENQPNIIFGTVINPEMDNELSVTVIATGFDKNEKHKIVPPAPPEKVPVVESEVEEVQVAPAPAEEIVAPVPVVSTLPIPEPAAEPVVQKTAPVQEVVAAPAPQPSLFADSNVDVRNVDVREIHVKESAGMAGALDGAEKTPSVEASYDDDDVDWDTPAFLREQKC